MSAERVIAVARQELGYTESPAGSNLTKYGKAYGWDGIPWCVIILWWCFREAGESMAFFGGAKTASCGTLLRWHREQGLTVPLEDAGPGDIVILNFSGTKATQHCGLVEKVARSRDGTRVQALFTIEGNTTPGEEGSQDNGGCVAMKTRYPSQVVAVCRPAYKKEEEVVPKKDYEGRWSEQHMRWADEAGLIQGYEDGTYRPAQLITREEVITLLHRYDALKEAGKL